MDESKFFRFVWRCNGLILMAAGVVALGVMSVASYKIIRDVTRERRAHNIVNVQDDADRKETWRFGGMLNVEGTPYLLIPLNSDHSFVQAYYSKATSSARNYLFLDSTTNERHWLFPNNNYLVSDMEILSEKSADSEARRTATAQAIIFELVKRDTNDDKRLTDDDLRTVALSLPSGKGYKEVVDGIDRLIGKKLVARDTLLLVYERRGLGYSTTVTLPEFVVSDEVELPKVGA